ncbi:MAG TPA: DUF2752 domain-containing protein [Verrucomicrobiae bacterium]|nr:DUF2752 domain-containing protein [Verrucomicrobiae bacterium]
MEKVLSQWRRIVACVGAALAAAGLWLVNPNALTWCPHCPLHSLTGLYCPGCGSTRALHQLVHGHLLAAFRLNPLAVVALPLLALWLARSERGDVKSMWIWTLLVVIVVFGVLRNLPVYPFSLLAPQP